MFVEITNKKWMNEWINSKTLILGTRENWTYEMWRNTTVAINRVIYTFNTNTFYEYNIVLLEVNRDCPEIYWKPKEKTNKYKLF